jgi:hypothetical protein
MTAINGESGEIRKQTVYGMYMEGLSKTKQNVTRRVGSERFQVNASI